MGVLEDAIREHLDLKRKHGAPEQELERQEVEALGPVRRDVAPEQEPAGEVPTETEASVEAAATELERESAAEQASFEDDVPAEPRETPAATDWSEGPVAEDQDLPELPPDPPLEPELEAEHDLPPDPDYHSAVDQPTELFEPPGVRSGDTPPRGFPAGQQAEEEELADDEDSDPLEDTPEFLQDAPEHDRLWFEQKPPRDFDFD